MHRPRREITLIWGSGRRSLWRGAPRSARWGAALVTIAALVSPPTAGQAAPPSLPSVVLTASAPSGQPVGTSITWTVTYGAVANPVSRFLVGPLHGSLHILRDFSRAPSFTWTPFHEGSYRIQATVKSGFMGTTTRDSVTTFTVTSRVLGSPRVGRAAVVSPTANPLVALYSAPPCAQGMVIVMFRLASGTTWHSLVPRPCQGSLSVNVLVAGMRERTQYVLQHQVRKGRQVTTSGPHPFTTGTSAPLIIVPHTVTTAPTAQADRTMPFLFHELPPSASPAMATPLATDLSGHLVWYYDTLHSGLTKIWAVRLTGSGTFLAFGRDQYHTVGDNVMRVIDLAGDTVRETNVDAITAQLTRHGHQPILGFDHDALRLANGDTAVIGSTQKMIDGHAMMGNLLLVLNTDLQVVWVWDAFDHLATSRHAPSGETCVTDYAASMCPLPDGTAEDWLHANSIGWSPRDGNLTLSLRSQDWVLKIAYQNGRGTGAVIWRLGTGGDFVLPSRDPNPWFSHQHDAHLVNQDTRGRVTLLVFDNGDMQCAYGRVPGCHSRGQELLLDEQHRTARLLLNVDLGNYAHALGSAQVLANGNLFFDDGVPYGRAIEMRPNGTIVYEQDTTVGEYRVYRLSSLDASP